MLTPTRNLQLTVILVIASTIGCVGLKKPVVSSQETIQIESLYGTWRSQGLKQNDKDIDMFLHIGPSSSRLFKAAPASSNQSDDRAGDDLFVMVAPVSS